MLGFDVLAKPEPLASRGGRWFVFGRVQVHLGVEVDFVPARKTHPALVVDDFDALVAALDAAGVEWRPDNDLPGARRCYIDDPFGNPVELIAQPEQASPAAADDNVTGLRSA